MSRRDGTANTYRFFVAPGAVDGQRARVESPELAHQLSAVLRLAPGAQVTLLDGSGRSYSVRLTRIDRRGAVEGEVLSSDEAPGEPRAQITCASGLIRPERYEWLLQKGTEIGVAAFAPLICQRTVRGDGEAGRKLARWERITHEAAEQSGRARLPAILPPQPFEQACATLGGDLRLLLWEGDGAQPLRAALRAAAAGLPERPQIVLLSGPEGGLAPAELEIARAHAIALVTLGPRTLRAETAPLIAAAAALYELGDLES